MYKYKQLKIRKAAIQKLLAKYWLNGASKSDELNGSFKAVVLWAAKLQAEQIRPFVFKRHLRTEL